MTEIKEDLLGSDAVVFKVKVLLHPDVYAKYVEIQEFEYCEKFEELFTNYYYFVLKVKDGEVSIEKDDNETVRKLRRYSHCEEVNVSIEIDNHTTFEQVLKYNNIEYKLMFPNMYEGKERSIIQNYLNYCYGDGLSIEIIASEILLDRINTFVSNNSDKELESYEGITIYASINFLALGM